MNMINKMNEPISQLFDLEIVDQGKEEICPSMNMREKIIAKDIGGFGIYCLSHKTEYGERIIYLGKFQGSNQKRAKVPGFAGNIVSERWFKHVLTITMRGRKLSFPKTAYDKLKKNYELHNGSCESAFALNKSVDFLTKTNASSFPPNAQPKTSYNRAAYACQFYDNFNCGNGDKIDADTILKSFTYHYWQVREENLDKTGILWDRLSRHKPDLSGVENKLVSKYKKWLPVNREYTKSSDCMYFHIDPTELIETSGENYDQLSRDCQDMLSEYLRNPS